MVVLLAFFVSSPNAIADISERYFLSEQWLLKQQPHAAEQELSVAREACEKNPSAFCRVVQSHVSYGEPSFLKMFSNPMVADRPGSETAQTLWIDALASLRADPGRGLDIKRALINLETLRRLQPKQPEILFYQAEAHRLQQNHRYKTFLQEAFLKKDARTELIYDGELRDPKALNDGIGSRWNVHAFYASGVGLGMRGQFSDTHLMDTKRSLAVNFGVGSKPAFFGHAEFEDRTLLDNFGLALKSKGYLGDEDFFGVGADTTLDSRQIVHRRNWVGEVWLKRYFLKHFHLGIGWNVEADNQYSLSGPAGELAVDTRDSRYAPTEGYFASVTGRFPSFERFDFMGEGNFYLAKGQVVRFRLGAATVNDDAPALSLPENSMYGWIFGVRPGRFRDQQILAVSPELRSRLGAVVTVCGFGTYSQIHNQSKWGAGIATELSFSRYLSDRSRLELGVYAGELNLTLGWVVG